MSESNPKYVSVDTRLLQKLLELVNNKTKNVSSTEKDETKYTKYKIKFGHLKAKEERVTPEESFPSIFKPLMQYDLRIDYLGIILTEQDCVEFMDSLLKIDVDFIFVTSTKQDFFLNSENVALTPV